MLGSIPFVSVTVTGVYDHEVTYESLVQQTVSVSVPQIQLNIQINDFVQLIYSGRQIMMETKINYIDGNNMALLEDEKVRHLINKQRPSLQWDEKKDEINPSHHVNTLLGVDVNMFSVTLKGIDNDA